MTPDDDALARAAIDDALLRQLVMFPPTVRRTPRWVAVRDTLNVGSTSAYALCRRFGLNPDEILRATWR